MARSKVGLLWKDFFREPSLWYDNRSTKDSFRYPDFRQRITYESLWIDGWLNPFWVHEELRRRKATVDVYGEQMLLKDENFVALLKACADRRDASEGIRLHSDIKKKGLLPKIPYLGSSLISMYSKCGLVEKAREVLEELPVCDLVSWNALIAGYASQGRGNEALNCFDQMRREGLSPDQVTFVCALKACGMTKAAERGQEIHDELVRSGLVEDDVVLVTALVDMYAKCGLLGKAREVLDEFPVRNTVAWNALITGFAQQGRCREALDCVDEMRSEGLSPDGVTFICILKACGSAAAIGKGEEIHGEIASRGLLGRDVVLTNALVDMYAKCGALPKAQRVVEEFHIRDVVCWNSLIAGHAHQGRGEDTLNCFEQMQRRGLCPDAVTYTSVLKACGLVGAADMGKRMHKEIESRGLMMGDGDIVLGNVLVDMYAKCESPAEARRVLEELPVRNVVSWSALIAGYAQGGDGDGALSCFEQMLAEGVSPNIITFICVLKACGGARAAGEGERIHEEIRKLGLLAKDPALGNALVDMYAKCGELAKARRVLSEELASRDLIAWNALIAGYAQHGRDGEAMDCFEEMLSREGSSPPDAVTFACVLRTCGGARAIDAGKRIHAGIESRGWLASDAVLGNSLLGMYARCGMLERARELLERLPVRDEATWCALMAGYSRQERGREAMECFEQMESEGLAASSAVTFGCSLKACGLSADVAGGERIHKRIVGLLARKRGTGIALGTALVDMYARCGELAKAREALDRLPDRHAVSWSALVAGYARWGRGREALECFERMRDEGHPPDSIAFVCALKACASVGAADAARRIHEQASAAGLIDADVVLGTALVHAYAKSGLLATARRLLDGLPVRTVVSWNALLSGCAAHGRGDEALAALGRMRSEGLSPDAATLLCVLAACSRSGLLSEARALFAAMARPNAQHATCLVAAFGHAGRFADAVSVLGAMSPPPADRGVWLALLATCRKWANAELGRAAFDQALCSPSDRCRAEPHPDGPIHVSSWRMRALAADPKAET